MYPIEGFRAVSLPILRSITQVAALVKRFPKKKRVIDAATTGAKSPIVSNATESGA
jgi:hypothetical protein